MKYRMEFGNLGYFLVHIDLESYNGQVCTWPYHLPSQSMGLLKHVAEKIVLRQQRYSVVLPGEHIVRVWTAGMITSAKFKSASLVIASSTRNLLLK